MIYQVKVLVSRQGANDCTHAVQLRIGLESVDDPVLKDVGFDE